MNQQPDNDDREHQADVMAKSRVITHDLVIKPPSPSPMTRRHSVFDDIDKRAMTRLNFL